MDGGLTASRLEPLQGGSLLFTTKSPEIPGTQECIKNYYKNSQIMILN